MLAFHRETNVFTLTALTPTYLWAFIFVCFNHSIYYIYKYHEVSKNTVFQCKKKRKLIKSVVLIAVTIDRLQNENNDLGVK